MKVTRRDTRTTLQSNEEMKVMAKLMTRADGAPMHTHDGRPMYIEDICRPSGPGQTPRMPAKSGERRSGSDDSSGQQMTLDM